MNMQKLHELAQSQMFELRAQSGSVVAWVMTIKITIYWSNSFAIIFYKLFCSFLRWDPKLKGHC